MPPHTSRTFTTSYYDDIDGRYRALHDARPLTIRGMPSRQACAFSLSTPVMRYRAYGEAKRDIYRR